MLNLYLQTTYPTQQLIKIHTPLGAHTLISVKLKK